MYWTDSNHATSVDPSDIILHAYTTNPAHFTNALVKYYLKATLDDYVILYPEEATRWVEFNVNIQNCKVTALTPTIPTASYNWDSGSSLIRYNIYTPETWISLEEFTETVDTSTYANSAWM